MWRDHHLVPFSSFRAETVIKCSSFTILCATLEMLRVLHFHWLANPLKDYPLSHFMQWLWGSKNPTEKFVFLCSPQIPVLWLVENRKGPIHPCIVAEKIIRYTFILSFPEITLKLLITTFYDPYFRNTPSKANVQAWPLILLISAAKDLSRNI